MCRRRAARLRSVREALKRAWDEGRPDPSTAFDRLGKAYLEFARTEPAYYSAMFEAGIPLDTNPELREAGDGPSTVLRAAHRDAGRDHAGRSCGRRC